MNKKFKLSEQTRNSLNEFMNKEFKETYIAFMSEQCGYQVDELNQMISKGLKLSFHNELSAENIVSEFIKIENFANENYITEDCSACDGTGQIEYIANGFESLGVYNCSACGGSGELEIN